MIILEITYYSILFGLVFAIITMHGGLLQGYRQMINTKVRQTKYPKLNKALQCPYCLASYMSIILTTRHILQTNDYILLLSIPNTLVLTFIIYKNLVE